MGDRAGSIFAPLQSAHNPRFTGPHAPCHPHAKVIIEKMVIFFCFPLGSPRGVLYFKEVLFRSLQRAACVLALKRRIIYGNNIGSYETREK